MSKLKYLFLHGLIVSLHFATNAQTYTGFGFANGEVNTRYQMPGTKISHESGDELNTEGVVTGFYFDTRMEGGPNFTADITNTFGIYPGNPNDAGGQDRRNYSTNSANEYAPIRWNGGSQMFRQGGQWVRYSIDFEKASLNFIYRGNVKSYAVAMHKFDLNIYDPKNMSIPLFATTIDLTSGFPDEGAVSNGVVRLGGGNDDTDWFKLLIPIEFKNKGTYVVELDARYFAFTHAPWGAFTFNPVEDYNGVGYGGVNNKPGLDTLHVWQFDKVGDGNQFMKGDKGVTADIYPGAAKGEGANIRAYSDTDLPNPIIWNEASETFVHTGAWYQYSFEFPGNKPYFFVFSGIPDFQSEGWKAKIQFIEPNSKFVVDEISLEDGVEFVSSIDQNNPKRWMYIKKAVLIPQGKYLVKIDFPEVGYSGFLSRFCFVNNHPKNIDAKVINYNWPSTIPKSEKYTVSVFQGDSIYNLFTHLSIPDTRPSLYPEDNGGNGVMSVLEDRTFTFCQFSFTDEIVVEVEKKFGSKADRVEIQPKAYGINPFYFDGRKVRFTLKHQYNRPSYISVNFVCDDNLDQQAISTHVVPKHGMVLFADKPEIFKPDKRDEGVVVYDEEVSAQTIQNADVIYFPPGDYNLKDKFNDGVIHLTQNDQKVYAEGGAFIRGAIWSEDFDNIWLYGRGIFSGWDHRFHELVDENGKKAAFMRFEGSDGCHIEGIVINDPTHHSIPTGSQTYFKNLKIIGWAYNQDGTRTGAGSYAEEVFFKTQDDRDYANRDHVLKNSVLWPMRNGAFGILGWQNFDGGKTIYDNLYFINSEWERPEDKVGNQGVIGSKLIQGANISNDTIKNLFLEDFTTILCILRIHFDEERLNDFDPSNPGSIKEFLFENIKVEQPFITSKGTRKYQRIEGYNRNGVRPKIHDITFRNLVVAGELITEANKHKYFIIDEGVASNIIFEAKGVFHTLRANSSAGGDVYPNGDIAVLEGTSQYVSIEPDPGYRIKDVKVDHQSIGALPNVCITDFQSDHLIEVEFEVGENVFDWSEIVNPNSVLSDTIDFGIIYADNPTIPLSWGRLVVYPNPASNSVIVAGMSNDDQYCLYDLSGKIHLTGFGRSINLAGLNAGMYIVHAKNSFTKLIVRH